MQSLTEDQIRSDLFRANRARNWIELCERRQSGGSMYIAISAFLMGFMLAFVLFYK